MNLTLERIERMTEQELWTALLDIEEAIRALPPVRRRPVIKTDRPPDVRTAFEDKLPFERIRLRMAESDLRRRLNLCPP